MKKQMTHLICFFFISNIIFSVTWRSNWSYYQNEKRFIDIIDPPSTTVDALMKLDLPAGVDIEIKVQ